MKPSLPRIRAYLAGCICVSAGAVAGLLARIVPAQQFDAFAQWLLIGISFVCSILLALWTTERTTGLSADLPVDVQRSAAHAYPFRIARFCFAGTMLAGVTIACVQFARGTLLSDALAAGVLTYLLTTLPILILYLWLRRVLKPIAQGPPGAPRIGGVRQTIGMRLMFVVQLPAVLCGLGLVLVQNWSEHNYVEDIAKYHAELHGKIAKRAERDLKTNVRFFLAEEGRSAAPEHSQPDFDWPALIFVFGVLGFSYYLCGAIADDVTIDLREISDGLARIDVPDPSPRNNPRVGLRETARIQALFGHATDGFKRQRLQIEYAAQQRREAEVRKGRFLAHISHELKSPLNSILGFSEVLLGELDGPMSPEQQVLTAQIWRHGDGLLRFILALLDLSRLDETSRDHTDNTGSSSLRSRRCTPAGLAQSLREQCRADPTEQIRLVVTDKTLPNTPEMMIDSTLTARVALLLAGALGDGIKDGEISVELSTRNDEVIISIAATELGEETHERRAFLRGWSDLLNPGGAKDVVEAISIPLRLAQTIVRIQGGRISMETDQPWPTLTLSCPTAGS